MGVVCMYNAIIAFPLIVGILGILLSPMPTFAVSTTMTKPTSGGSLYVVLQPSPDPIVKGTQTNFKVNFDQKGTNTVQPHIDYDVTISNSAGKQLFNAVTLAGQSGPSLHTSDGIITIPYTFQEPGTYTIKVSVFGILFNPINPEFAQFQVNVT
jgi:hypothetical protein